jgi:hypothetical protein
MLRVTSEQKIAHAAANPERGEGRLLQACNNFFGDGFGRIGCHLRFTIYWQITRQLVS